MRSYLQLSNSGHSVLINYNFKPVAYEANLPTSIRLGDVAGIAIDKNDNEFENKQVVNTINENMKLRNILSNLSVLIIKY